MAKVVIINDDGTQRLVREVADNYYTGDILFRDDYFATKLWCRDDIAMRIQDNYGREATEKEIDDVINHGGSWWGLNDCTDGEWDCIDWEIEEVLGKNIKTSELIKGLREAMKNNDLKGSDT